MKIQPFLLPAAPCTTHSSPGACCPSAPSQFGTSKDRRRSCFPFLPRSLFAAEYPLEHAISQCRHCKEALEGHRRRSRQPPWQSHLISSSTRAGQWQLGSGFVAGAAAPVESTEPHEQQVSSACAQPQRIPAATLQGWGQWNPPILHGNWAVQLQPLPQQASPFNSCLPDHTQRHCAEQMPSSVFLITKIYCLISLLLTQALGFLQG